MSFNEIQNWIFSFFETLSKKKLLEVVVVLRNKIEDQAQEIKKNEEEAKKLKDEINRLKGEKGRPDIKPNNEPKDDKSKGQNNTEKKPKPPPPKRGKKNRNKKEFLKIHNTIELNMDKNKLPADAKFKGTRSIVIQDIEFKLNNTKIVIPVYYSKELGKILNRKFHLSFEGVSLALAHGLL